MSTPCIQSIGDNIYLWKLISKPCSLPQAQQNIIGSMNEKLIEKFFSLKPGETESLSKECMKYFLEIKKMLPNLSDDFKAFFDPIVSEFNTFNSELGTLQTEKAHSLLKEAKASYRFEEIVPRVFLNDLHLKAEEIKFMSKMLETHNFTEKYVLAEFIDTFKEFIPGFDAAARVFIMGTVSKIIKDFNGSYEINYNYAKNKITEYLANKLSSFEYVNMEIYHQLLIDNDDQEEQWILISSMILVNQPMKLNQVVKLSATRLLITVSLEYSEEMMLLDFNNFIVKLFPRFFKYKSAYFAKGSIAESLIILVNDTLECYKAVLLDSGLKLTEKLPLFDLKQEKIFSACYIKHEEKILYIYRPGGIEQFALSNSSPKSFSNILPQRYSEIFISDCERFIFLVSESKMCMFDSKLNMIDLQDTRPVFIQIIGDKVILVCMDEEFYVFKRFKIGSNHLSEIPNVGITYSHVMAEGRRTLELGSSIFRDFLAPKNDFSNISAVDKNK